ncbi:MAG: FHA domain-containing protein [Lachnospiraceae bacterium]|nr:FHA domain-containing protein [Lachnospiraceae bacterium]
MLDVKYHKDLNHNYMMIKAGEEGKQPDYQHKMITENKIQHLLSCKIRYVDGEACFYYEISSRQSLKSLFEKKMLGIEQLIQLFGQMGEVSKLLEKFLLDSRCLVLNPEYIYVEPETEEYFFVYYPPYQEMENREEDQTMLAEFLVERADHGQEESVSAAYKIYELIQDRTLILSEIHKILDTFTIRQTERIREEKHSKEAIQEDGPVKKLAEKNFCQTRDESDDRQNFATKTSFQQALTGGEDTEKFMDRQEDGQIAGSLWSAGILTFLCIVGAVGIFCLVYYGSLSEKERLLSVAGIILLSVLAGAFLFYVLIHLVKYKKSIFFNKTDNREQMERVVFFQGKEGIIQASYEEYLSGEYGNSSKIPQEYGNTVFMESSIYQKENKLYGINKGNKYHIDLDKLPCTVGKLAGSVDIVIKDSTVSRIHARLSRQEEGVYVTDLNSTNGTFKNGLRLDPNESVLIEQGDELRFGKMTFCYR